MPNNPIHEMIAAFAVGCMDKENFIQFKDYLSEGGELPKVELGELQNIVSMIPIILDLETPDPSLKDKVAKKLIGMKDEIKTKIREERGKTFATQVTKSTAFGNIGLDTGDNSAAHPGTKKKPTGQYPDTFHSTGKIEIPAQVTENVKSDLQESKLQNDQPQSLFAPKPSTSGIPDVKPPLPEKVPSGLIAWIALLLTIILFSIIGYFTYSLVNDLNRKVEELESKLTSLRSELATSTAFVNKYISLIEFFNYKNVLLVNLSAADPNEQASARVFLAFNEKEGLVEFKNVKALQPNQGYQLWLVTRNQSYSMGVYTPNGNEYMRITSFPFIPQEQAVAIKMTIESNTGSPTPSIQSFLEGAIVRR